MSDTDTFKAQSALPRSIGVAKVKTDRGFVMERVAIPEAPEAVQGIDRWFVSLAFEIVVVGPAIRLTRIS
jgi:hypothetical protein